MTLIFTLFLMVFNVFLVCTTCVRWNSICFLCAQLCFSWSCLRNHQKYCFLAKNHPLFQLPSNISHFTYRSWQFLALWSLLACSKNTCFWHFFGCFSLSLKMLHVLFYKFYVSQQCFSRISQKWRFFTFFVTFLTLNISWNLTVFYVNYHFTSD